MRERRRNLLLQAFLPKLLSSRKFQQTFQFMNLKENFCKAKFMEKCWQNCGEIVKNTCYTSNLVLFAGMTTEILSLTLRGCLLLDFGDQSMANYFKADVTTLKWKKHTKIKTSHFRAFWPYKTVSEWIKGYLSVEKTFGKPVNLLGFWKLRIVSPSAIFKENVHKYSILLRSHGGASKKFGSRGARTP